jgi:hypothetical protein
MRDYIDPKQYGLRDKEPEPEPAVWAGMPAGPQNMANVLTRVTLLLQVAWRWLLGRLGVSGKPQ